MNEEFIIDPLTKLANVKLPGKKGETNLALRFHEENQVFTPVYYYIEGNVEDMELPTNKTSNLLNDRILKFEREDLKAKLDHALIIENKMVFTNESVKKSEAAEAFSFLYHLLNPANCRQIRETYERVFEVLELGPILPASILVENVKGGLSDMQRKAQRKGKAQEK